MRKLKDLALGLLMVVVAYFAERHFTRREDMPPTTPLGKAARMALILALGIIAINAMLCMTGCGGYIAPISTVSTLADGADGTADCDSVTALPVIRIKLGLGAGWLQEVRAHEQEHTRRMFRYGCKAFLHKFQTDSTFRLDEEAAAYCAQARWMAWRGTEARVAVDSVYQELLLHKQGRNWNPNVVLRHLPCAHLRDNNALVSRDGTLTKSPP